MHSTEETAPIEQSGVSGQKKAICLACGPSLTQADVDYIRGKGLVIAVNNAYQLAPWADVLYAADANWWKHYQPVFNGIRYCAEDTVYAVKVDGKHLPGLSPEGSNYLHYGGNSGYQAVNLAVNMGAKDIYLLGYDMTAERGKHFFGEHPGNLNRATGHFGGWIKNFHTMKPHLEARGITITNCTRHTALDCFPKIRLEDAL